MKLKLAGNLSSPITLRARSGPSLYAVSVNSTISPTCGFGLVTDLVACRSASSGSRVTTTLAVSVPPFPSLIELNISCCSRA
jgi:hypothetical protein